MTGYRHRLDGCCLLCWRPLILAEETSGNGLFCFDCREKIEERKKNS